MGWNPEGFGENDDVYDETRYSSSLEQSRAEWENITYLANNVLSSVGKRRVLSNGLVKRMFSSKELHIEDVHRPSDITDACQLAHDWLIGQESDAISYELRIFSKGQGDTSYERALFHLGLGQKELQYHATLGGANGLHTCNRGEWEKTLSSIAGRDAVKQHPLPTAALFYTIG